MTLPHAFQQTRLHLIHSETFPAEAARSRREFIAPTHAKGNVHATLWIRFRDYCRARWVRRNELDHSIRGPGGSEHPRWEFDYESGYRFGSHVSSPSEDSAPQWR